METVDGEPPYMEFHPVRAYWLIMSKGIPAPTQAERCSPELLDFFSICTSKDPAKRLELLHDRHHPFLAKADTAGMDHVIDRASRYSWYN